ncbi:hypothetical protein KRE40_17210 [Elizabethkingia meningoseptica]|uniref:hypothetical protein n=1 Tax=Elizabethkingia meningoseptica TaxID=238 RepID=UPI0023AFF1AB|nr:hypothetical protein [Elizabethkingia meningoseptica]MDE5437274.1 hypothetical protein [Elizabethkingia meningoseptica]MDE5510376.1 hypothetical protein [Elizabethkingia meningoseptica]MDE5514217.1 hypothetical protein [Elizabethkingia meningoseptica]MDE5524864.1 hypothetical protein [Elizabethkingia meningoseptica]MDE5528428.1 hypothetical protein [Elizabethkingia meningoseptica]
MKTNILNIILALFSFSCSAQRVREKGEFFEKKVDNTNTMHVEINTRSYENFYKRTVENLNKIIVKKKDYYGKPLSLFLGDLQKENLKIIEGYSSDAFTNNALSLYFLDWDTSNSLKNRAIPSITVTFEKPFDGKEVQKITKDNQARWNENLINFYKGMIIKEIRFYNISGVNVTKNAVVK